MNHVECSPDVQFDAHCDVAIIGAGAAGLIAGLRASELGAHVVIVEREALAAGSTALSAGLIPAAGTRFQRAQGINDDAEGFAADIMAKANGQPDPASVDVVTRAVVPALEWLADTHDLAFSVITNFAYPGHTAQRMHGLPSRSGTELMDRLRQAAESARIDILLQAKATTLFTDTAGHVTGIAVTRPDGSNEQIGCKALILACNGYGGNPAFVSQHIPHMADALYFGHPGNQGDAITWGSELGAAMRDLAGHQGHGSVAHPHGILITWATMTEGGFQVNAHGERFSDESHGYSEHAAALLAQPGGIGWSVFDGRIADVARQFADFQLAEAQGAILMGASIAELATAMKVPPEKLMAEMDEITAHRMANTRDRFGRNWANIAGLVPPFHAVRVTGALFHTQGGLEVDDAARVRRTNGGVFANLFAAGGAACGVSGHTAAGYLSGNGLLTAVAYGYLAGQGAALFANAQPGVN